MPPLILRYCKMFFTESAARGLIDVIDVIDHAAWRPSIDTPDSIMAMLGGAHAAVAATMARAAAMTHQSPLRLRLLLVVVVAGAAGGSSSTTQRRPPSPPTEPPPVPPSARDRDWIRPFERADLLYHAGPRPDFAKLLPMERCGPTTQDNTNCTALWWPGLGNGFLGGIAQGPTLRIAGLYSGFSPSAPSPAPDSGFSQKDFAYRASIPAYASSIVVYGPSLLHGSSRAALNTRDAVYYERSSLVGGGKLEMRTYFHQTRRNLIVVEVEVDCTRCTNTTQVSLRTFTNSQMSDLVFHQKYAGAAAGDTGSPRQIIGLLRTPENCEPSVSHLYDTNITLGYVYDICPESLTAAPGARATLQLLSALTLSSEEPDTNKEAVVSRAMKVYQNAKRTVATQLLDEHRKGWSALWDAGGIELSTQDLALQQTTNSTLYYLLMSTRPDWLHSTLVPSTIAAAAPYPHGYNGHVFWDQDTFQVPPLMVFYPDIAKNILQNRLFQLPAYQINAKAFGLKGAYVPWEVGFSGGFARDNLVNHEEVHVAGDVALFIKQYYQLTQNCSELRKFFPLLEGVADFVVSRINGTDENGWLSIENIVAPDESTGERNPNHAILMWCSSLHVNFVLLLGVHQA
jgi:hypothetical protein